MIQLSAPAHITDLSLSISGSKSISNRYLILKHSLNADVQLHNLSDSEDTQLLQKALKQIVPGMEATIDVHHAGTDLRFLTALLAITPGSWLLTGSARLQQRPVGDLLQALRSLGADISCTGQENFPPLRIKGKALKGGRVEINTSISSQFVSALLLIAPVLKHGLELILKSKTVSRPYIDMTLSALKEFGVKAEDRGDTIFVHPFTCSGFPSSLQVESDWSSASYWYGICALMPSTTMQLSSFYQNSTQADAMLPMLYKSLGVETQFKNNSLQLTRTERTQHVFEFDFTHCPDIAQTLAVTCVGLGMEAKLTGLQTLRIKETDRIAALKNELEKAGAKAEATDSSLHILARPANSRIHSFSLSTYNDHRMAMSFAPLSLLCDKLTIRDEQVVGKSYPRFWADLQCAGFNVNLLP